MSELEAATAPVLEPIMMGEPRTLDVAELGLVALWAAKMTMVWEATHRYVRAVSDDDYAYVFRWRTPPPGWRVWIAAYASPESDEGQPSPWNTFYFKHPLRLALATEHGPDAAPVEAEEVNGHLCTFGVRAFVFQTFGAFGDLDIRRPAGLHERRFARYLRPAWPLDTPVRWPPEELFDDATLGALIDGALTGP